MGGDGGTSLAGVRAGYLVTFLANTRLLTIVL